MLLQLWLGRLFLHVSSKGSPLWQVVSKSSYIGHIHPDSPLPVFEAGGLVGGLGSRFGVFGKGQGETINVWGEMRKWKRIWRALANSMRNEELQGPAAQPMVHEPTPSDSWHELPALAVGLMYFSRLRPFCHTKIAEVPCAYTDCVPCTTSSRARLMARFGVCSGMV